MNNDKYISLSDLPLVSQIARRIYLNSLGNGFYNNNDNQFLEMLRYGNLDRYYNNNWR